MNTHTHRILEFSSSTSGQHNLNWIHLRMFVYIRSFLMANWRRHLSFRARTEISVFSHASMSPLELRFMCMYEIPAAVRNNKSISFVSQILASNETHMPFEFE